MSNSKILNRLREYSKFSAIFALLKSDIEAQVIYTDVDPDIILSETPQGIWLDIDENGSDDIGLQNYSFTTYSFSLQETHTFQFLLVIRYDEQNAIAGITNLDSNCFPYALPDEELINSTLSWQNCQTQFLAFKRLHSGVFTHTGSYENWYNSTISETIDHYLGVRFIDEFGGNHYGWIRCDVLDEGRTLVLKDYAYETQEEYPLVAGDTSHYVNNENFYASLEAVVYSFNKQLYINIIKPSEVRLFIWDITGNEILERSITSQYEVIPLNSYSTGTYLIELRSGEQVYRTKIVI